MTDRLDPKTTALLVMDMQTTILDMLPDAAKKDALLARTAALLERAPQRGGAGHLRGPGIPPGLSRGGHEHDVRRRAFGRHVPGGQ